MSIQSGGLFQREVLAAADCLARLSAAPFARVLISVRCLPGALPVYLSLVENHVLIATDEEAVIEAARAGDVLAVQIDGTEEDGSTWSVQATGTAYVPTESLERLLERVDATFGEKINHGATLIAIPTMVLHGERVQWRFPR